MRDFARTKEPSGKDDGQGGGFSYIIQKHAATRLHYDFRLELGGSMKSWAVTRGPSLDPADKRLAVHVEDHPLSYSSFEGTIPKGEYGGGTVMLWDRGTWEPIVDPEKGYRDGNLKFFLHGERLKGEWHLVRMQGRKKGDEKHDNWLLLKHRDAEAKPGDGDWALIEYQTSVASKRDMQELSEGGKVHSVQPRAPKSAAIKANKSRGKVLPDFVEPQLATLVSEAPESGGWLHEVKYDGYRLLARVDRDGVTMLTRNRQDWTHKFTALAEAVAALGLKSALLDGEAVVLDEKGASSFGALKDALSNGDSARMDYYLFDALFLNGEDLRLLPLAERKARLKAVLTKEASPLRYSSEFTQSGGEVFRHACRMSLEGIISKRADAPYRSGRGKDWVKTKCLREQEMVIGGYTEQENHPGELGALLLGYYEGKTLRFGGKVGTGYTRAFGRTLLTQLAKIEIPEMPFDAVPAIRRRGARFVKPTLVAQIRFTEWTEDNSLRHPAFLGLREDKPARTVTREKAIAIPDKVIGKKPETAKAAAVAVKKTIPAAAKSSVVLTHPERVLFKPDVTKAELAAYYEAVAPWMLPEVAGRPISLVRCPEGSRYRGKACFFQRHGGKGLSKHIREVKVPGEDEAEPFLAVDDVDGLVALSQMGALELHTWGARADTDKPTRLVFDFDPDEALPFAKVKEAASEVRDRLAERKLISFLKTTGGKGLHVVVPIVGPDWTEAKAFTQAVAREMEADSPERYTSNIRKATRRGKILIDYFRNDHTASSVAPYSTRNRENAPVALPLAWEQLPRLKAANLYHMRDVPKLLAKREDPWAEIGQIRQKLPKR